MGASHLVEKHAERKRPAALRRIVGQGGYFQWERLSASIVAAGKPLPQGKGQLTRKDIYGTAGTLRAIYLFCASFQ
jgi:hypothetical protein